MHTIMIAVRNMPTLLLVRTRQPQSNCQVPLKNAHLLRLQSFLLPPSDEETTPLMETEGITSASCFIVETMVQLDEYLSSESCSCEQIESNTTICESFSTTLEDCLALGEDIYEIKPFVFSNPVSNLNWRPIGLMKVGLIQQHKSNKPLESCLTQDRMLLSFIQTTYQKVLTPSVPQYTFVPLLDLPRSLGKSL